MHDVLTLGCEVRHTGRYIWERGFPREIVVLLESRHWNQLAGGNSAPARVFAPPRASFQCNYVHFSFLGCVYGNAVRAASAYCSRAPVLFVTSQRSRGISMRAAWQPLRTQKGIA